MQIGKYLKDNQKVATVALVDKESDTSDEENNSENNN